MDLVGLTTFHQIIEHGGIGRASRATAIPKTSLSRRLRQLEEGLGVRLVDRGPRLFRLTEEGVALHEGTRALLTEIDEVGHALAGGFSRPSGSLRISAPTLFTDVYMGSIAADFAGLYPDVVLEIVSENRMVDPLQAGFDAVIRVNPDADGEMVGRLLYRDDMLLVSTGLCPPPTSDGGEFIPAVMLKMNDSEQPWAVEGATGQRVFLPRPMLRMTSILAARQAVLAGAGAAVLPRSVIADDLTNGHLTCWGKLSGRPVELWILHRSRRLRSPKLSAFVDFVSAAFADQRAAG